MVSFDQDKMLEYDEREIGIQNVKSRVDMWIMFYTVLFISMILVNLIIGSSNNCLLEKKLENDDLTLQNYLVIVNSLQIPLYLCYISDVSLINLSDGWIINLSDGWIIGVLIIIERSIMFLISITILGFTIPSIIILKKIDKCSDNGIIYYLIFVFIFEIILSLTTIFMIFSYKNTPHLIKNLKYTKYNYFRKFEDEDEKQEQVIEKV